MVETSRIGSTTCGHRHLGLSRRLLEEPVWSDDLVAAEGIPVGSVPFVTIGGGLGSLAMVQVLRVAGVPASSIRVLSDIDLPHESFQRLAEASQIGPADRLRSASDARADAIWGWPGYAMREAVRERRVRPLWEVLTEPILSEYYTPRARDVYESVEREARRLRWMRMLSRGTVQAIRRRVGGGYFVAQHPLEMQGEPVIFHCRFAHIAVGHLSPRLLPELRAFRGQYPDSTRVVHAYEPHEHVYEQLRSRAATVVIRGAGIVASRVLQRLMDDRERFGSQVDVVHVMRTQVLGPTGPRHFRRDGGDGFSYQPFNFPKAAFGGQLKERLEGMEDEDRLALIQAMGGTSTSRRKRWRSQIEEGTHGGWYRQHHGEIAELRYSGDGSLVAALRQPEGGVVDIELDFMIDATGLEDDLRSDPFLADLVDCLHARTNALGALEVESTFEIPGIRNDPGRVYASGAVTVGGSYAPVDSFLGLQHAALAIGDDLAGLHFCARTGAGRSMRGWWRWARGATP